MKRMIYSDGFDGYAKRALGRARKLSEGKRIRPEMSITFEDPLTMTKVLTAERIRLCQVARRGNYSITALATDLKRDPKSVRRDVVKLEGIGMLRARLETNPGHGRTRVVEAIAKKFHLQADV